jgi:hypothetical protein
MPGLLRGKKADPRFIIQPPAPPRFWTWRRIGLGIVGLATTWLSTRALWWLAHPPIVLYGIEAFIIGLYVGRQMGAVGAEWAKQEWHEYDRKIGRWMIEEIQADFDRHRQAAPYN